MEALLDACVKDLKKHDNKNFDFLYAASIIADGDGKAA